MVFKNRIWLETKEGILVGEGRLQLLKAIDRNGSISQAAKSMGMSYKKAWKMVDQMNDHSEKAIVEKSIGGKGGGGTHLTTYGRNIILKYEEISLKCDEFLAKESLLLSSELKVT